TLDFLGRAMILYTAFAPFYLGVPVLARRLRAPLEPTWGGGAVLLAGLGLLLFVAAGPHTIAALWGLALLLAILDAGIFIEGASGRLPGLSLVGGRLSGMVVALWWGNPGAVVRL